MEEIQEHSTTWAWGLLDEAAALLLAAAHQCSARSCAPHPRRLGQSAAPGGSCPCSSCLAHPLLAVSLPRMAPLTAHCSPCAQPRAVQSITCSAFGTSRVSFRQCQSKSFAIMYTWHQTCCAYVLDEYRVSHAVACPIMPCRTCVNQWHPTDDVTSNFCSTL